jgi:hypothetical protein
MLRIFDAKDLPFLLVIDRADCLRRNAVEKENLDLYRVTWVGVICFCHPRLQVFY